MGGSSAARKRRVKRVLELSTSGMTIPLISAALKKEGIHAFSERTVWDDLNSVEAQEYLDELIRKQLIDITIEKSSNLRMKYRGQLIMRLLPSKVEQKVEGEVITYNVETLLDRMLKSDAEALEAKKEAAVLEENL